MHGEVAGAIETRNVRVDRGSARGKNQGVVRLLIFLAGLHLAHFHLPRGPVDGDDFGEHAHVKVKPGLQAVWGLQEQCVLSGNFPTHEIGQAAVGKGHMRSTLENGELSFLGKPPRPRRRRHRPQ